ncbi:MAG: hypothetical protein PHD01_10580 [Geobacteraceae bacterium]|nr:hypothetical protein [Geobacteraceae bacterium]
MRLRKSVILFVAVLTALISSVVSGYCEEMTRGFVSKVNKYRVVIAVPQGGERTFDLTKNTTVILAKRAIPLSELRRNTLVQLTSKNGAARQILVVEVPK